MTIVGRRVQPDEQGDLRLSSGDYGQDPSGVWYIVTPNGHAGNLAGHKVVEHEDGTITVSPSILIKHDQGQGWREVFHGYLERGIWRECQ